MTMDALLQDRDYTVIIAKTGSDQVQNPTPGFEERWQEALGSVLKLAQACEALDVDGITLYVAQKDEDTDCQFDQYENVSAEQLNQLIKDHYPPRRINLNQVLQKELDQYFERKAAGQAKPNGEMILILLDGEPGDRIPLFKTIVKATQRIDRDTELGIGFMQVGDDLLAKGFFQALDDNLQGAGAKFDIVHTCVLTTIDDQSLTNFLLEVIND